MLVSAGRLGLAQGVLQIVAGALVILLGFDLLGLSPIRNAWGFAPIAWLRRQFNPLAGTALFPRDVEAGRLN